MRNLQPKSTVVKQCTVIWCANGLWKDELPLRKNNGHLCFQGFQYIGHEFLAGNQQDVLLVLESRLKEEGTSIHIPPECQSTHIRRRHCNKRKQRTDKGLSQICMVKIFTLNRIVVSALSVNSPESI